MDSPFDDIVEVIDTKRPEKKAWEWSRKTFERFQLTHPGRYKILGEPKMVVNEIKVKQLKVDDLTKGKVSKPAKRETKTKKKK